MQKFIDEGWYTVPLQGTLKRLPNGDKTIPKFEKKWKEKYTKTRNTKVTKIGGVITGPESNIMAIDCDNKDTYELFKSLDPDYTAIFESDGKDAGTFIYRYDDAINTFSPTDGDIQLDIYSLNGFVYLPTAANGSKHAWDDIRPITTMPVSTRLVLLQMQKRATAPIVTDEYVHSTNTRPCLAPLLTQFVGGRGEFMPSLFKIVTPVAFRQEEQYQKFGYLHPNNVPAGRGSEYLSKLSAILGADESVNEELYVDCLTGFNELFQKPMDSDRLDTTVMSPMLEQKSSIDGKPIWTYNEFWADKRMTVTTKHGLIIDLAFDDNRNIYYYLDMTNELMRPFTKDTEFVSYLDVTVTSAMPKKAVLKKNIPLVHITSDPSQPFGFCKGDEPQVLAFNSFNPSPELNIIHNPADYAKFYKRPITLLRYLETLVPNLEARDYLLGFLKRKLTKFEYSPVILFFLGVPGSGKDTFVQILEKIMTRVARPTTNEFLEKYNTWLLDTYFVQLDEYGDQLNRMSDKEMAKGLLKSYSGKAEVEIRDMRTKGMPYRHNVTFIMTANKNPLMVDDKDRRIHLMDTPNVLATEDWFDHDKIISEVKDFCYYLAKEVKSITKAQYMSPPQSDDKHVLIADSMYAAQKIVYALEHDMREYLIELSEDHNTPEFAIGIKKGVFTKNALEALYDELTDYKGDSKTINKMLRKKGFTGVPTTVNNQREYLYYLKEHNPFEKL